MIILTLILASGFGFVNATETNENRTSLIGRICNCLLSRSSAWGTQQRDFLPRDFTVNVSGIGGQTTINLAQGLTVREAYDEVINHLDTVPDREVTLLEGTQRVYQWDFKNLFDQSGNQINLSFLRSEMTFYETTVFKTTNKNYIVSFETYSDNAKQIPPIMIEKGVLYTVAYRKITGHIEKYGGRVPLYLAGSTYRINQFNILTALNMGRGPKDQDTESVTLSYQR